MASKLPDYNIDDIAEAERIELETTQELCRRSFYQFFIHFWEFYNKEALVDNWHIKFCCDEAQEVMERIFKREPAKYDLIINIPPGSSKSSIFSQALNAWAWTRDQSIQILSGSHTGPLSLRDAVKSRDIIRSDEYKRLFPEVVLRKDTDAKSWFANTGGGVRMTCSVDSSPTGRHAHVIIIDDPINPVKALSELERDAVNDWFDSTLSTRKVDKKVAALILVMQRLNENDPPAHLLKKQGNRVRHICLPAELADNVEPKECLDNYKNGLLDPVRLDRAILDKLLIDLGQYSYAGQMQQSPVAQSGNLFKTECFKTVKALPSRIVRIVRSWDKAGTEDGGCRTAGVKLAELADKSFIFLDSVIGQWQAERREAIIKDTAKKDRTSCKIVIEMEGGSGGKESAEATVKNLVGFTVKADRPTGDKALRAEPLATQVNIGNVYILEGDWNTSFVEEFKLFPRGRFKDQVDAASQAFAFLAGKKGIDYGEMVRHKEAAKAQEKKAAPPAAPKPPRVIGGIVLPG